MARQPYGRDVTVGVSSSSGLAPLLRRAAERWQDMPVSLQNSRPHRCGVYAFDTSDIMRAFVRTGPTGVNIFCHRTYCNALFIVFVSGVFAW